MSSFMLSNTGQLTSYEKNVILIKPQKQIEANSCSNEGKLETIV